ncbi:MAG: hypothetical protein QNJ97_05935 [Myxococcota bacterium]|nr:hypothetical protein [Myxococcota bacterium]
MTLPRRIIPNTTYLVTRRCTQRQFLLKPTKLNTNIFTYCLAIAAQNSGVLVHAICVLSNHYHAVVTDTKGNLPQFMEYLHKYVAKTINASLGRWENFWASEKPSAVALQNPQDVLDKIAYTICNPVEAGLVAKTAHWPGVAAFSPGQALRAKRPDVFFRANGPMPPSASLAIAMPPQFVQFSQGKGATKDSGTQAPSQSPHRHALLVPLSICQPRGHF